MENLDNQIRMLPIFNMAGTDFYVDTRLNEFRERDAPWNRISLDEVFDPSEGSNGLVFDTETKNVYQGLVDPDNLPKNAVLVVVPSMIELDPVGLARKHGLADDEFTKDKKVKQEQTKKEQPKQARKKGRKL